MLDEFLHPQGPAQGLMETSRYLLIESVSERVSEEL